MAANEILEDKDANNDGTKELMEGEHNEEESENGSDDELQVSKQFRITMQSNVRRAMGPPELTFEESRDESNL